MSDTERSRRASTDPEPGYLATVYRTWVAYGEL